MKLSTKGALFSGLLFPGSGQIALKCYKRGIALMLVVLVCLSVIIKGAVEQAFSIIDKLDINSGMVDINEITSAVTQSSAGSDSLAFKLTIIILIFWAYSIIDAYYIGKEMDADILNQSS